VAAGKRRQKPARTEPVRVVCMHKRPALALGTSTPVGSPDRSPRSRSHGKPRKAPAVSRHVRETVAALRQHCPTPLPVAVKLGRVPDHVEGQTIRNARQFTVRLDRTLDESTLVNVLLHEWAHCCSWSLTHDRVYDEYEAGKLSWAEYEAGTHDGAFGLAFAKVYVAYSTQVLSAPATRKK